MTTIHALEWLNTDRALSMQDFAERCWRSRCSRCCAPAASATGLPQAARIASTFSPDKVAVIGLHSVFEHHAPMTPVALRAFLHEYRIRFPVAVDLPGDPGPLPRTMAEWQLEGTPTLVLFDRQGQMRARHFGQVVGPGAWGADHGADGRGGG
jgi:hypothetical protein